MSSLSEQIEVAGEASGVWFACAGVKDDADIRAFVAQEKMAGAMEISVRTDPSFLAAACRGSERADVLIARTKQGEVVGLGVRAIRRVYWNGEVVNAAHLSYLRVAESHRRKRDFLRAGYAALRAMEERDPAAVTLTAVLKDNSAARRLLERGHRGMPRYQPLCGVATFTVETTTRGLERPVHGEEWKEATDWLRQRLRESVFGPADLVDVNADEGAVTWKAGQIAGVATFCDLRAMRQVVVERYATSLRIGRPFINTARTIARRPLIPPTGAAINLAYVSCLMVDKAHPEAMPELLAQLATKAKRRGIDYLVVSLPEEHPGCKAVGPMAMHRLESVLYTVEWPGQPVTIEPSGIPYIEAALL